MARTTYVDLTETWLPVATIDADTPRARFWNRDAGVVQWRFNEPGDDAPDNSSAFEEMRPGGELV
ncbi:MAG: hypothetical protein AAFN13_16335, partial [Bacteroidota bacterium]